MTRPICLITGASAGIGAASATLAAQRGYDVAINYNTDRAGAETVAEAAKASGARTCIIQADVSDPQAITAMYAQVDTDLGPLDALINNAGIVGTTARVTELTHARLKQMFDVNVIGAILVAQEAVKRMEPLGRGVIINVTSAAARLGSANTYVDYAASKAAMDIFTKGLSDEVAAAGLRIMGVAPGIIDTAIHGKGGDPDCAVRLAGSVPMQRMGSAMEVAQAILWLMSPEASYVTGSTLNVTGGR
ncbi:MAG: SDR family oxidoreductase [Sulfitobacter sp.]